MLLTSVQRPRLSDPARVYLRISSGTGFVFEKDVVIAVGIKRRVKVNKIDRLVLYIVPQDLQIVAVVESVHEDSRTGNVALRHLLGKNRKLEANLVVWLYRMKDQDTRTILCADNAISAIVLCRIESRVGRLYKIFLVARFIRVNCRHADAHGYGWFGR